MGINFLQIELNRYDFLRLLAIVGIAILAFYGFKKGCSSKQTNGADTVQTTKVIPKTVPLTIHWNSPKPDSVISFDTVTQLIKVDTSNFDTSAFMATLDTGELVKDYLKRRYYSKEFSDSNFTALLKAQVHQNRLDSVSLEATVNYNKEVVTNTVTKKPPKFIATFSLGYKSYQPGVLYRLNKWYIGANYEFSGRSPGGPKLTIGRSF